MRWPAVSSVGLPWFKNILDTQWWLSVDVMRKPRPWVIISINHNGKRVKAVWHHPRRAIVACFLWLTNYVFGSGGGIPNWWDMQPLGGEIYWYGFCAATGALNQCDQAGRQAEGNGAVLRVNYTQSHTQFTPANLVRKGADEEAYTCWGVACMYNP